MHRKPGAELDQSLFRKVKPWQTVAPRGVSEVGY